jgi:hypothetical protein
MKLLLLIVLLLGVAAPAYCANPLENVLPAPLAAALQNASTVTLFSLDPAITLDELKGFERLRDWVVLGQTDLLDSSDRAAAATAITEAVKNWKGGAAMCFNPRHALRVTTKNHVYDFIVCFECSQMQVYDGRKRVAYLFVSGTQEVFDRILTTAKIPLPKPSR